MTAAYILGFLGGASLVVIVWCGVATYRAQADIERADLPLADQVEAYLREMA